MPEEGHDFDNTVVAILDEEPAVRDAAQGLAASGTTLRSFLVKRAELTSILVPKMG